MAVFTVTCKECRAALKSSKPVPAGTVITCPKCGVMFAAPASRPVAATVGGVETVEDVEVVEDVEIVDETPAKPVVKKPARLKDDDDDDEEENRPRKFGGNKRKKTSPTVIILSIAGILAGLGAVGGLAFLAWKLINASGDLVNYAPDDATVIAGGDLGYIMNNTPVGPYIALALNANPQFGKYKREANLEPMSMFDRFIFGWNDRTQAMAGAVSTKAANDKTKLSQALNATSVNIGGRDVYQFAPIPGSPKVLFPSSKTISIVVAPPTQEAEVIRSISRSKPNAAMSNMIKKAAGSHAWVVIDTKSQTFYSVKQTMAGMMPAEEKDSLEKIKAYGAWAKMDMNELALTFQVQTADAAAAKALSEAFKKNQEKMKPLAEMLILTLPPGFKAVVKEMTDSTEYGTDNDCATQTMKVKMTTLDVAVKEMAKLTEIMAPPPAGHQGR